MLDQMLQSGQWASFLIYALAALLLFKVVQYINTERTIKRLGGHAPVRRTWLPFGLDFVYDIVRHSKKDSNLRFWHKNFMLIGNPANPYTFEVDCGGERIIVTADPENVKAILATQFNDFGKGEEFNRDWHEFLGDSIFTTDGKKWHDSRQLIRSQFLKDRVSDLAVFERHVSQLLSIIEARKQEVDVKDLFFRLTLDAATDFLFGRSVDSLQNPQSAFAESFGEVQRIQNILSRVGPVNRVFPRKNFRYHLKRLNAFVEPFIEEALGLPPEELEKRTKSEHGYTFLHAIASYNRDRTFLRDQLVAVLLAGRDTTACTLSWLFYELGRNGAIVKELRKEIEDTVGLDRAPTYADLKSMKFLQNNLNETLRIYPVVPFNIRSALQDTSIPRGGGPNGDRPVGVPKETGVAYSTHYMQLTPEIYPPTSTNFPAPHVFHPHRWDDWQPRPWTYIPFNGGPRICVGQQFALTEMAYVAVRLLQRYSAIEALPSVSPQDSDLGGEKEQGMVESERSRRMKPLGDWIRGSKNSGDGRASLVENAVETRDVDMKSDIVLSPADKVNVRFVQ
ncbi:MAG: hypothetical protein M1831_006237 [Alyxoria varia]|nr:MAG: hypothetical protein M1831_006237 [Alyxoria varia]